MLGDAQTTAPSVQDGRLRIDVRHVGTTTTIRLTGEWDLAAREATSQAINRELDRRPEAVVLDLSQLSFIDSSGIHVLLDLNRCAQQMNVRLLIVPGPSAVQRIFELCALADRLPFTRTA
jgi:anti-anti-sigma factor